MNTDIIILISTQLLTTIVIVLAIINQSNNLNKKIDDLNNRLTNLEIKVETGFEKINSKLDISDIQYHNTNETVKSTNQTTNQRVDKLESDFKEFKADQKSLINKILDLLPKKPLL